MADYETTPATVGAGTEKPSVQDGTAGELIEIGKIVRLSNGKWYKANDATQDASGYNQPMGISASYASALGDRILVYKPGCRVAAGFTEGIIYFVGTDGDFKPSADNTSNDWITYVGVGQPDGSLICAFDATGVQVP